MSRADTQHMKRGKSIQFDFGTATLGTDGTVTIYTHLNRVQTGVAGHRASLGSAALQVSARTEAGKPYFTITDPAGAVSSGDTVNYLAAGF